MYNNISPLFLWLSLWGKGARCLYGVCRFPTVWIGTGEVCKILVAMHKKFKF